MEEMERTGETPSLPPPCYPPQHINPAEDPLAAFEAAMAKLDREKASRGRATHSPPRAYRATRSRSRERYREYREFSPRRRSPGLRRLSPRGPRTPSPGPRRSPEFRGRGRVRTMADIPPETEEERRERERFERELKERERRDGRGRHSRPPSGRSAPQPPPGLLGSWEFKEDHQSAWRRWRGQERPSGGGESQRNERGSEDRRTPSLSPEPGSNQHREDIRREESRGKREDDDGYRAGLPKFRDERDERPREDKYRERDDDGRRVEERRREEDKKKPSERGREEERERRRQEEERHRKEKIPIHRESQRNERG